MWNVWKVKKSRSKVVKKKPRKVYTESYAIYLKEVLKIVHPDGMRISAKSLKVMDGIMQHIFEMLASKASEIYKDWKRWRRPTLNET